MPTEPLSVNEIPRLEATMSKYDEIINLPHHESASRKPMSLYNRAAQFAPFSALSGHDEAIAETARLTSAQIESSADELKFSTDASQL